MAAIDPSFFADVADALGISSPAIVEKDYYVVQLIDALSKLSFENYTLIFAGGTCLSKAYKNTYRMSEDVDMKLVPTAGTQRESNNKQRQLRRKVHSEILATIKSSACFSLVEPAKKLNEGRYQQLLIEYPQQHKHIAALRPHLQLDITESTLLEPAKIKSIRSLYAQVAGLRDEVAGFPCVSFETTASEKFVALLRRTAALERNEFPADDTMLVRHIYDLHLIGQSLPDFNSLHSLVQQVIEIDREQFSSQHKNFLNNPYKELQYGLQLLTNQTVHQERYEKFIGPLVYHPSPASWDEAIETVLKMATAWLS